jgi:hypothetical protein
MDSAQRPARHDDPSPQRPAPADLPEGGPAVTDDDLVDQAGLGSFPASDSAPWTTGREPRPRPTDTDGGQDYERARRRRHVD